jgi:hypothetical protein
MDGRKFIRWMLGSVLAVLLGILTFQIVAQDEQQDEQQQATQQFSQEQLDQMLAPIALYPDKLLSQILVAATYPLDVVSADRFAKEHSDLKGDALLNAAKDETWDPSVKALLAFPDVLDMMDKHLDWTSNLGTAFLNQQDDVMNSIQKLRAKAYKTGNLKTTKHYAVKKSENVIYIEPTSPSIVYVPVYDPRYVYGTWWYPEYQPFAYYPYAYYPYYASDVAGTAAVAFLTGVAIGSYWGWGSWNYDWHHHHMYYDSYHYNNFAHHYYSHPMYQLSGKGSKQSWQFNPLNRQNIGPHGITHIQGIKGAGQLQGVGGLKGAHQFQGAGNLKGAHQFQGAGNLKGAHQFQGAGNLKGAHQFQGVSGLKGANKFQGVGNLKGVNQLQGVGGVKGFNKAGQFGRPSLSATEQKLHAGAPQGFKGVTTAGTFKGAKFQGAHGKSFTGVGEYKGTTFKGTGFQGAHGKSFTGMSGPKGTTFKGGEFHGKGFTGASSHGATIARTNQFHGVVGSQSISGPAIHGGNFSGSHGMHGGFSGGSPKIHGGGLGGGHGGGHGGRH